MNNNQFGNGNGDDIGDDEKNELAHAEYEAEIVQHFNDRIWNFIWCIR